MLELFGMPVLKASGEAEGLCAQLNREGRVDACITSDSDAFLFGAKCIIKNIKPNSQEPFECYEMSDVEIGLGLKRKHLIAIGLLVGNDHDLKGVQGIEIETALSFVKSFNEDEVLDRLCGLGSGNMLPIAYEGDLVNNLDENTTKIKLSHCSLCGHPGKPNFPNKEIIEMYLSNNHSNFTGMFRNPKSRNRIITLCGHPGSKRSHLKDSYEVCISNNHQSCVQKPIGFKCNCMSCDQDKKEKEQKKNEAWKMRVCSKISTEPNFPNKEIIEMYLSNNHSNFTDAQPFISWKNPNLEMLIDYIAYKLNWEPSLLGTLFIGNPLLYDKRNRIITLCGHPGSKRSHLKDSYEVCISNNHQSCVQKPIGFKCNCMSCDQDKKEKEQKKNEAWKMRVCSKISTEPNFPNKEIIEMYLSNNHSNFTDAQPFISWKNPNLEMLIYYIAYKLNWETSFIRQKVFPLLSTIFLRNIAKNQEIGLLYGQYEFDFIQRTKIRFGHMLYVVTWTKHGQIVNKNNVHTTTTYLEDSQVQEDDESVNNVHVDNGCLMTDENMDLVMAAYPEKVQQFMQQKESKESKSKKKGRAKSTSTPEDSRSVQLNITEFYRSSKGESNEKLKDNDSSSSSSVKRNVTRGNLSKSARRRLLFG
ncbi:hypothetical protein LXL04_033127 [Taraxacum kok-saghyz]